MRIEQKEVERLIRAEVERMVKETEDAVSKVSVSPLSRLYAAIDVLRVKVAGGTNGATRTWRVREMG